MRPILSGIQALLIGFLLLVAIPAAFGQPAPVDSGQDSVSSTLLDLPTTGSDEAKIDYAKLPELAGVHAVISPADTTWKFQLHDYLVHYGGRYWCMWSQGPPVEDEPSQQIRYATSEDGLQWSEPKVLVAPEEGYGYIARGFWVRDGQLLALAAHFKGKGAFGVNKELQLRAFAWDEKAETWTLQGAVFDNAINNFPPQPLPTGDWMMTRRDSRFNVFVLIGGQKGIDAWQSYPVVACGKIKGFSPDEPIWWPQPDGSLTALFRNNGTLSRLFRAVSTDQGRTWSSPVATNFPNAASKLFSLQTSAGYRVLISNANPSAGRRQLHLSISEDGVVFTRMALLVIPSPRAATLQYPHAVEHDGHLLIVFSRNKNQSEILKIPLQAIEDLRATPPPTPGRRE